MAGIEKKTRQDRRGGTAKKFFGNTSSKLSRSVFLSVSVSLCLITASLESDSRKKLAELSAQPDLRTTLNFAKPYLLKYIHGFHMFLYILLCGKFVKESNV